METINKEYRSAAIGATEQPEENQLLVSGYAAVIEQPTVICEIDGVQYFEIIDKDAFIGCDMSDVPFKYNHSDDFLVLARTRNKTLSLTVDNKGLFISANLAPVQAGKDLYGLIQRGDIDKMSFGFTVGEENYDSQTRTRRILKIDKLWDVSAVDTPAYDGTSIDIADGAGISVRDYFTAQVEMEKKLADEEKRKRLYLMTF
jgi:hypothetical protein